MTRAACCFLIVSSWPLAAAAQSNDPAAARDLFRAGRDLVAKGDWSAGCAKFQASNDLYPSVGALINLATCREREGKLASAQTLYVQAELLNEKTPTPAERRAFAEHINKRQAAIAPRVPKLTITVDRQPPGLRIVRNGQDVPLSTLGTALPADPGDVVVTAEAPGWRARDQRTLREADAQTIALALKQAPLAGGDGKGGHPFRTAGWVTGGLGATGVAIGAILGGLAIGQKNAAAPHCDANDACDQTGVDARAQAIAFARGSTAMFVIGGAALATGIVLLALPAREPEKAELRAGPGGVWLRGSF